VPENAVPCTIHFQGIGLASLNGGSRKAILAQLMPALEQGLDPSKLSDEELGIISLLNKRLTALEKTVDERKAAHLIAARAHLKEVLALSEMAEVCILSPSVLSPAACEDAAIQALFVLLINDHCRMLFQLAWHAWSICSTSS
jgi:hypothetical protein